MTEVFLAEEKYAAFVPHGVHTHAHSFFLLWLLFLQDKANHHLPSPLSLLYVVSLYLSFRKLRDRFSTYFGISNSVHPAAAAEPRLLMLSRLLLSILYPS